MFLLKEAIQDQATSSCHDFQTSLSHDHLKSWRLSWTTAWLSIFNAFSIIIWARFEQSPQESYSGPSSHHDSQTRHFSSRKPLRSEDHHLIAKVSQTRQSHHLKALGSLLTTSQPSLLMVSPLLYKEDLDVSSQGSHSGNSTFILSRWFPDQTFSWGFKSLGIVLDNQLLLIPP